MLQLDHRPPKEPHEVLIDQTAAQSNPNPNPKHISPAPRLPNLDPFEQEQALDVIT